MIKILENYLYLLTEDAEMEALNQKAKELRKKVLAMGSGPNGADRLGAKYAGVDPKKIPPHDKKILDDYKKVIEDYQKASDEAKAYSKWAMGGKTGPKPGTQDYERARDYERSSERAREYARQEREYGSSSRGSSWDDFWKKWEEDLKKSRERREHRWREYQKSQDDWWANYEKERQKASEKFAKRQKNVQRAFIKIYAGIFISALLYQSYVYYRDYLSKAGRACKKYTGTYKDICMLQYKINALKKQKKLLEDGIKKCKTTTNPSKCENNIKEQILKIDHRISKIKAKAYKKYHVQI